MPIRKVSFGILLLLSIALLLFATLHLWLHQKAPPSVETAENALATKNLFLIGHLNHDRLNSMLELVDTAMNNGIEDPSPFAPPGLQAELWNTLYSGTGGLQNNMDQLIFAMTADPDTKQATTDLVVSGGFSRDNLLSALKTGYEVTPQDDGNYQLKKISDKPEKRICPTDQNKRHARSPYIWLHISEYWLLVSNTQQRLQELMTRLGQQAPAEIELGNWRLYRNQRLMSIGLLTPESAAASGGMTGFMVGGAAKKNPEVSFVFAGADLGYQPIGAAFNAQINTADKQWVTKKQAEFSQQLNKMKTEAAALSPTLSELLSGLDISADDTQLNLDATIQLATIKKIPDMVGEAFASIFSFGSSSRPSKTQAERINETPWNYVNNNKLQQLPAFNHGDFDKNVMHTQGPFAVDLSSVSLGEKSGLTEIAIETKLEIPEIEGRWWDSKAEIKLMIEEILSHEGQELMRDELCIKDDIVMFGKNRDPYTSPLSVNQGKASIRKTIRLKENVTFNDIQSISGQMSLSAPTSVKALKLAHKQGQHLEHNGVRVFIRNAGQQELAYRVSGEKDRLIEIRAFNKKGQVLQQGSSWSSSDGNASTSYAGDIDRLTVYIADKKLNKRFDFKLNAEDFYRFQSEQKSPLTGIPDVETITTDTWGKLEQLDIKDLKRNEKKHRYYNGEKLIGQLKEAPFMLSFFHNDQSSWDNKLKFELYTPLHNSLINNMSAVALSVLNQTGDKTYYLPIMINPGHSYNDEERKFIAYVVDTQYQNIDYDVTSSSIEIGLEKQQAIQQLKGELLVRLPQEITTIELEPPKLGKPVHWNGITLALENLSRGMIPRLRFAVSGKIDQLIEIAAVTASGEKHPPAQIDFRDEKWMVQYDLRNDIEKFSLTLAEKQLVRQYPFDMQADYSQ